MVRDGSNNNAGFLDLNANGWYNRISSHRCFTKGADWGQHVVLWTTKDLNTGTS
jgi:hypothetical protein